VWIKNPHLWTLILRKVGSETLDYPPHKGQKIGSKEHLENIKVEDSESSTYDQKKTQKGFRNKINVVPSEGTTLGSKNNNTKSKKGFLLLKR